MKIRQLISIMLCLSMGKTIAFAQDDPVASLRQADKITSKYTISVSDKSSRVAENLDKQTERYLNRLQRQEAKLQKKLAKIDSLAALNIFANSAAKYEQLQKEIKGKSERLLGNTGKYVPWLDTASTALKFLETSRFAGKLPVNLTQIKGALAKVHELEVQLKQAENIKQFVRQRKEYVKQALSGYNLGKELKKYNRETYYYAAQVNEYKEILNDPDKLEKRALSLLRNVPAFQKFMEDHGVLSGLFNIPQDYAQNMEGLQTLGQVQGIIQERMVSMGPSAAQTIQQNINAAQSQLSEYRNRYQSVGDPGDLPDFKLNNQHIKSFWNRLEYGTNIQTIKDNYFFPTTTDMAFSVGYRLNETNVLGLGASYKMGWGKDIQHIAITNEGIGLRSYADIKIKGSFYASGGFEYNYQQPFSGLQQINSFQNWAQSGLLGISKIISLKTKLFKKTKLQLFWDFLSDRQRPATQPIKFRVGYNF